ncbi:hypothetical protein OAT89_00090 [bacterium]|nr:hypothetical protein [bacterium]
MQLTTYQNLQLRDAIELKFDAPIRNQSDCQNLSAFIEEKTNKKVSSHTLRRFFEIVQWDGEFRVKTLDILADFAGFSTISAFVGELRSQANISQFLKRNEHKDSDVYFYEQLIQNAPSIDAIMVVATNIQKALVQKDMERAMNFLRLLSPLNENPQKHYNALMLFSQFVGPTFYEIENENVIKRLVEETPYSKLVLSNFVPVLEIDRGFGLHIKMMLRYSSDPEEQAYGNSLLAAQAWRSGNQYHARELTQLSINSSKQVNPIPPILKGRIDFLSLIQKNGLKTNFDPSPLSAPKYQELFYFKAIATEVVLLKQKRWCEQMCNLINLEAVAANNWIEQSILNILEIAAFYGNHRRLSAEQIRQGLNEKKELIWPRDHRPMAHAMIKIVESELA